ncbi:Hpt domain-containing protein [uncultured Desulfobacter sp.]|uniref:response regulator n=1 Tax=uncultured Desulfobacter sp. TaxID=240139 RepID=UPI0029F4D629|nr:Hpt domain-containing protein [uncultured Desulfobacter sp.]
MSGLDAAMNIRKYEKEHNLSPVTIIALTAHAMKQDRELFLANGMNDYITKPLTARALSDAIERTMPESYGKTTIYPKDASIIQRENDENVVDMAELREIMSANKSLLDKCTRTFKKKHGPVLTRIMESISADDGPELQKSAHQLKGMLKYLAAKSAAQTAYRLEQMGAESNINDASALIVQLQDACKSILDCLENVSDKDGFR